MVSIFNANRTLVVFVGEQDMRNAKIFFANEKFKLNPSCHKMRKSCQIGCLHLLLPKMGTTWFTFSSMPGSSDYVISVSGKQAQEA